MMAVATRHASSECEVRWVICVVNWKQPKVTGEPQVKHCLIRQDCGIVCEDYID